jgi:hypothetical protein
MRILLLLFLFITSSISTLAIGQRPDVKEFLGGVLAKQMMVKHLEFQNKNYSKRLDDLKKKTNGEFLSDEVDRKFFEKLQKKHPGSFSAHKGSRVNGVYQLQIGPYRMIVSQVDALKRQIRFNGKIFKFRSKKLKILYSDFKAFFKKELSVKKVGRSPFDFFILQAQARGEIDRSKYQEFLFMNAAGVAQINFGWWPGNAKEQYSQYMDLLKNLKTDLQTVDTACQAANPKDNYLDVVSGITETHKYWAPSTEAIKVLRGLGGVEGDIDKGKVIHRILSFYATFDDHGDEPNPDFDCKAFFSYGEETSYLLSTQRKAAKLIEKETCKLLDSAQACLEEKIYNAAFYDQKYNEAERPKRKYKINMGEEILKGSAVPK